MVAEAVQSSPCGSCDAKCCKGEAIWLMPDAGDVVTNYTRMEGVHPLTGLPGHFIPQRPSGAGCFYLGDDDRCTIYENRPVLCREFTCWEAYAMLNRHERKRRLKSGLASADVYERGRHVLIEMGRITR